MDATVRVAEIREIVARSMHISMANLASVEETIMSTLSDPEMRQCLTPQMLCETYGLSLEALDFMLTGHGLSLEDLASESLENLPERGTKDAAE